MGDRKKYPDDIEAEADRKRTVRWESWILDMDNIFYDDVILHTETLTLPHLGMYRRSFMMVPVAQMSS